MQATELQRLLDASPVHRALRLRVAEGDGDIVLRADAGPEHLAEDGADYLHGGVVATVLDTTATFALIGATGADWNTVDLRVDYLRPAPPGELLARGNAVQIGKRLGRASAELFAAESGRLVASATGTFARANPDAGGPHAEGPDTGGTA
jgi:uncharacterized protein (TIGR00369 family)